MFELVMSLEDTIGLKGLCGKAMSVRFWCKHSQWRLKFPEGLSCLSWGIDEEVESRINIRQCAHRITLKYFFWQQVSHLPIVVLNDHASNEITGTAKKLWLEDGTFENFEILVGSFVWKQVLIWQQFFDCFSLTILKAMPVSPRKCFPVPREFRSRSYQFGIEQLC